MPVGVTWIFMKLSLGTARGSKRVEAAGIRRTRQRHGRDRRATVRAREYCAVAGLRSPARARKHAALCSGSWRSRFSSSCARPAQRPPRNFRHNARPDVYLTPPEAVAKNAKPDEGLQVPALALAVYPVLLPQAPATKTASVIRNDFIIATPSGLAPSARSRRPQRRCRSSWGHLLLLKILASRNDSRPGRALTGARASRTRPQSAARR